MRFDTVEEIAEAVRGAIEGREPAEVARTDQVVAEFTTRLRALGIAPGPDVGGILLAAAEFASTTADASTITSGLAIIGVALLEHEEP